MRARPLSIRLAPQAGRGWTDGPVPPRSEQPRSSCGASEPAFLAQAERTLQVSGSLPKLVDVSTFLLLALDSGFLVAAKPVAYPPGPDGEALAALAGG